MQDLLHTMLIEFISAPWICATYLTYFVIPSKSPFFVFLFEQSAFQLLQDHNQVCGNRVGIIGLSFGVALALRIATHIGVKVCLSLSSI